MKRAFALALALTMLICCFTACGGEKALRFGTGGVGGTYYAYGNALAQMISEENADMTFSVKTTAGSAANLRLLREGFLQLAVVQSDMLACAAEGEGIFVDNGPYKGYAAIAGLYTEACQIDVSSESDIKSVYDLAGKRVSIGERESGVLKNAEEILLSYGISLKMIEPFYLSFADSSTALEKGEIDAFFCTAGAPTNAISELSKRASVRLLPVDSFIQNNMMKTYSGYTRCTIPAGTYGGQTENVETVGVKAVLVATAALKEDDAAYITKYLLENGEKLRYAVGAAQALDLDYAVEDVPCGFHKGAAEYYAAQGVTVKVALDTSGKRVSSAQD
ncbi:MAG: TAXI family TRAP transporter solute-binding subunit [Clostridia bacterium]|nr:TAXI family TRAP transporter solute-binding subunit [Clostridia bacterium]